MKLLFVCAANINWSLTGEAVFKDQTSLVKSSAIMERYADLSVSKELIECPDIIWARAAIVVSGVKTS